MFIRDSKFIPQEVENFLLGYETTLGLNEEMNDEIELIRITHSDIFEGVLRYWKDGRIVLQIVLWNSWYNDLPEIYNLVAVD